MAKKRKCRRSDEENKIHEEAVKLRKMTDAQLLNYIEKKSSNDQIIRNFISELSKVNGFGNVTINKIKTYAFEHGFIKSLE